MSVNNLNQTFSSFNHSAATVESNIDWIGKIPESWTVKPLKAVSSIKMGQSPSSEDVVDNGSLPFLQGTAEFGKLNPMPIHYCDKPPKKCVKGDILLSVRAPVGDTNIADQSYGIGRGLCAITAKEDPLFLMYSIWSNSDNFQYYSNGSTFEAITVDSVRNFMIAIPPVEIQHTIASYIDVFCNSVDTAIYAANDSINKLEQYMQSVITECVTRGLDSSVQLKDSGIAWVGPIPEHWDVTQFRSVLKQHKKKNADFAETNVLSLSYGVIKKRDISGNFGLLPESFETYNVVQPGNIVLRLTDLQNDKKSLRTGLVKESGIITSAYLTLEVPQDSSDYYHYYLHAMDVHKEFYNLGDGVRQSSGYGDFSHTYIPHPNIEEQRSIASFLDALCTNIDSQINYRKSIVEGLVNLKRSVVFEYVTGKKQVPVEV